VARLQRLGVTIRTGCRVAGLEPAGTRVGRLMLPEGPLVLEPADSVILAVPAQSAPGVAAAVLPDLSAPTEFESILNLHYRADVEGRLTGDIARARFAGLVGGIAEWVFIKPGIVSVTVSAANHLSERSSDELAAIVWREIRTLLAPSLTGEALPDAPPAHRVVREKRATFAATPAQERLRPQSRTRIANLALAGDWTATGLPATIEGAMRSGLAAAREVLLGPASGLAAAH